MTIYCCIVACRALNVINAQTKFTAVFKLVEHSYWSIHSFCRLNLFLDLLKSPKLCKLSQTKKIYFSVKYG